MARYIKPTLDTKFHIDFDWWQQQGRDLRVHLYSHLCQECQAEYAHRAPEEIDWVSMDTGEVKQVDILWHVIRTHCSQQPDYLAERVPLTTAVFRVFLANDNTPLTPRGLHQILTRKSPNLILRTIGGHQIYMGIRPVSTPVRMVVKKAA
ncbi:MAG: hypothetical protein Kow0063_31430 [Anaerolineae bacterium]